MRTLHAPASLRPANSVIARFLRTLREIHIDDQATLMSETASGSPHLNEPTPPFPAKATHGERSLADDKGKWLILFSHPADFTPVCTTGFIGLA